MNQLLRCMYIAFFLLVLGGREAAAKEARTAEDIVRLSATPVFGEGATAGRGFVELVARVENPTAAKIDGVVRIVEESYGREPDHVLATARTSIAPGATVRIHVPVLIETYSGALAAEVRDGSDKLLAHSSITVLRGDDVLLVDLHEPSRLNQLRNWALPSARYGTRHSLSVGSPAIDRATGDWILPRYEAGYAAAAVVLMGTETLAHMGEAQLRPLVDWIAAGGTLALTVTRPEDLDSPRLTCLTGGAVVRDDAVVGNVFGFPTLSRSDSVGYPYDDDGDPSPMGGTKGSSTHTRDTIHATRTDPSLLSGYRGGNLRPTDFGASATYGIGQVLFLAFDPTSKVLVDDAWTQGRVVELVRRAHDRRRVAALHYGHVQHETYINEDLRRSLDPNENFRPALAISAVLIVVYAIFVGPLLFGQARRRGKLFAPLVLAPAISAVAFFAIVLTGLAMRGWNGGSRRIALVELGAGMHHGHVMTLRGFFTGGATAMAIAPDDRGSTVDVGLNVKDAAPDARLSVSDGGLALVGVRSRPWSTLLVRDLGTTADFGSVSMQLVGRELVFRNATPYVLRDVVVHDPRTDELRYFESIAPDESRKASVGAYVGRPSTGSAGQPKALNLYELTGSLDPAQRKRMEERWKPWASIGDTDFWSPEVPVLIATLEGAPAPKDDSGLKVRSHATAIRVVGLGGNP